MDEAGRAAHIRDVTAALADLFEDTVPFRDRYLAIAEELAAEYEWSAGNDRIVFLAGESVVKLPLRADGMTANGGEAMLSEKTGKTGYIPVADCAIIHIDGLPVLLMEAVQPVVGMSFANLPDWVGSVDCAQVGYDKAGQLVAYDL